MGTNTLVTRSAGQEVQSTDVNQYHQAIREDLVPRNASGAPTTAGGDLGTATYKWKDIQFSGQLIQAGSTIDLASLTTENHLIQSGAEDTSGYPIFLEDASATTTGRIAATTTDLVMVMNGVSLTLDVDTDITGLTAAPSTNNTCAVNDTSLVDGDESKYLGEDGQVLTIDTIGTEISSLDGTVQCFQKGSEYFLAYVDTTNNQLFPFMRGVARTDRETLADNDTLTLMKANYVFIEDDGLTTHKTVLHPTFESADPGSPTSNQWVFNTTSKRWRRYSGSWSSMSAHWLGFFIVDSTQVVAAHANDFDVKWKDDLAGSLHIVDTETVRVQTKKISVAGIEFFPQDFGVNIDITVSGDRESGVSEAADTLYYIYADKTLNYVYSDKAPRFPDRRLGMYHPSEYWRCIGWAYNDGSSNIVAVHFFGEEDSQADHRHNELLLPHFGTAPPVYIDAGSFSVAKIADVDSTGKVFMRKDTSTTVDISTIGAGGMAQSANLAGTLSSSGTAVTGVSTTFLTDFVAGDPCYANGEGRVVASITNDLALTLVSAPAVAWSADTYKRGGEAPDIDLNLYEISDKVGSNVSLICSHNNEAGGDTLVDLPTGYSKHKQLPFSLVNDSSEDTPAFKVTDWARNRARIIFNLHMASRDNGSNGPTNVLDDGTATTDTQVDLSGQMPETSETAIMNMQVRSNTGGPYQGNIKANGESHGGFEMDADINYMNVEISTDSGQLIEYKNSSASLFMYLNLYGYVIDQVT